MIRPLLPWIVGALWLVQGLHGLTVSSNLVDSPVDGVFAYNAALAPSLLGQDGHVPGQAYGTGNPDDPLVFFSVIARTVMPSVDGRVSSNRSPFLVWSWAQDHYPVVVAGDTADCGHRRIQETFDHMVPSFILLSRFNGVSHSVSNPGNPADVGFSPPELQANAGGPLSVWISGSLVLYYHVIADSVQCIGACGPGGCSTSRFIQHEDSVKSFAYGGDSNALSYSVIPVGAVDFLAAPFANRLSLRNPQISWLSFTHAHAAKYYAFLDGQLFNASYLERFSIDADDQGVWTIHGTLVDQAGLDAADAQGNRMPRLFLDNSLATQHNVTAETALDPVGLNGSFDHVYAFSHQIPDAQILGLHNYTFALYDEFGNSMQRSYSIAAMAPSLLTLQMDSENLKTGQSLAASAKLLDQLGRPLSERQIQFTTLEGSSYALTDAHGVAHASLSWSKPGLQTVTASFKGDPQYAEKTQSTSVRVQSVDSDLPLSVALQSNSTEWLFMVLVLALGLGFRS